MKHAEIRRPLNQPGRLRWLAVAVLASGAVCTPAWAVDLLESYRASQMGNAELLAARSAAQAGREAMPIARGQLLPNASATYNHFGNFLSSKTLQSDWESQRYMSRSASLAVRQPLYRPLAWAGYERSLAMVANAEASLATAEQDAGVKVARAYFDTLLAIETQVQIQSQLGVITAQLQAARKSLEAGQGTRTDVDDAQARLDITQAKELSAREGVLQTRQELQSLINAPVQKVRMINKAQLVLATPQPDNLEHWWSLAEQKSPSIAALVSEVQILRADVDRATAGHKPTLDGIVQRNLTDRDSVFNSGSTYRNTQVGLALTVPLFSGGAVSAQVRQAVASLSEGEQKLEAERLRLRNEVRKEFQGVRLGAQKVRAMEQAERSAQQALISSERGFAAGTRSRLDILNAQQQLSQAVLDLARERLSYLLASVRLHGLVGMLDEGLVAQVNRSFEGASEVEVGVAGVATP